MINFFAFLLKIGDPKFQLEGFFQSYVQVYKQTFAEQRSEYQQLNF